MNFWVGMCVRWLRLSIFLVWMKCLLSRVWQYLLQCCLWVGGISYYRGVCLLSQIVLWQNLLSSRKCWVLLLLLDFFQFLCLFWLKWVMLIRKQCILLFWLCVQFLINVYLWCSFWCVLGFSFGVWQIQRLRLFCFFWVRFFRLFIRNRLWIGCCVGFCLCGLQINEWVRCWVLVSILLFVLKLFRFVGVLVDRQFGSSGWLMWNSSGSRCRICFWWLDNVCWVCCR